MDAFDPPRDEPTGQVAAAPEWPAKGYDGPEPWELAEQHLADNPPEYEDDPYTGPGAVTHNRPTITYGYAGQDVDDLAQLLKRLGYRSNTIAAGENPSLVLDNSVMADVKRFCADYNVHNDIREHEGKTVPAQELVNEHVGPYVWQALEAAVAQLDR